jgi:hypothetical protein
VLVSHRTAPIADSNIESTGLKASSAKDVISTATNDPRIMVAVFMRVGMSRNARIDVKDDERWLAGYDYLL